MGPYLDAALLLVGHGSTFDPEAAAPIYQHAAQLRARHLFAHVSEAFFKQSFGLQGLLETINQPRVFIQPVCMSEGYFTQDAIPQALGLRAPGQTQFDRIQRRGSQTFYYCAALGTHPSMAGLILARAAEVLDKHPFPRRPDPAETALFVTGHGTLRHENSRRAVEDHVTALRAHKCYFEAHSVFLEEAPFVGDCYTLSHARQFVIVPFFISEGPHTRHDIPVLLGEPEPLVQERLQRGQPTWRNPTEKKGKLLWYARCMGTHPQVADIICERVEEAARLSAA